MKYVFVAVLLLTSTLASAATCSPARDKNRRVDEFVSKQLDVDGDGVPDKIELHLMAKKFTAPFKWELKFYSNDRVIYKRKGNNERIDKLFSDPNYVGDCAGYEECKCQWYFQKFFDRIDRNYKVEPDADYIRNTALKNEAKKDPTLAKKAIKNAAERIHAGKAKVIMIFDEPEDPTPSLVWMPEFNRFVPIYQP